MNQELIQKTKNHVFQVGSRFPEIMGSVFAYTKEDKILELEIESLAAKVLKYLKKHKSAYVSDLSDKLDAPPTKILFAIRKLETEGHIA